MGANLEERGGHDNSSPLFAAVYCRQEEVVKFLLEQNADTSSVNKYGNTPLHVSSACVFGSCVISEMLLAKGAKCDAGNNAGETPAHYAAHSGQPASLRMLLRSGADQSIKDCKGFTVLHSATQRWLCSKEDDEEDYNWMLTDSRNIVRVLLDNYTDVWATLAALTTKQTTGTRQRSSWVDSTTVDFARMGGY